MLVVTQKYKQDIDSIEVRTPKIEALRQAYFSSERRLCAERSRLATESWKETEGQPLHIRRAKLFAKICDEVPVAIFDHELIVGSQTAFLRGVGLQLDFNPKVGLEVEQGDRRLRADQAEGIVSEEDLKIIIEDSHYWKGRSPGEVILQSIREVMGSVYEEETYDLCQRAYGILSDFCPEADYEKVLKVGLKGIIEEIDNEIAKLQFTSVEDGRKYQFLRAAKICCEAEIRLAKRYAELARQMAAREADVQRKKELEIIAEVCSNVPENPARSFWEALQSVRFIHLGLYLEGGQGSGASLRRVDQYLYPLYKSDMEEGKLTRQQAAELLAAFWVKIATTEATVPAITKISGSGYLESKVILGGVDRDGNDASNELTYLILHVAGQLRMGLPIYLRWHSGAPRELMIKGVWTNIQTGSEPAFHNDEQTIPGLVADGASLEDARDYVLHGCVTPHPYGSVYGTFSYFNGGKILELVMYNGHDPRTGKQLGIQTGDPCQFTSIDDWINAYSRQWEYMYNTLMKGINIGELAQMQVYSMPFASAMMPDCIQKGLSVHEGGGRYLQFMGDLYTKLYADIVDSLMAIDVLVYKEHKLTIDEILKACANNFEGERGEYIRSLLNSTPQYGNDLGEPERIYRLLNDFAASTNQSGKSHFGYPKRDAKLAGAIHSSQGRITGALPNGRKAGMPLADGGISPCAGRDTRGPTVTMRSAAKALNFDTCRSGVLNMKIPKSLLKTEEHINRFYDLIETYFKDYNGYQIQWNIQDREVYLAAKANPEAYKDLVVRVGGFSAYFVELDSPLQDQIIARTEQTWG